MSKIGTLFSSSSGNCALVSSKNETILIDAGVSAKQILLALARNEISLETVKGIFITHTHSDHVKGLRVLLKKINVPVYGSKETLGKLILQDTFGKNNTYYDMEDSPKFYFDMNVKFFRTSHDCTGSGGYQITMSNGDKVSVCTDLGVVTDTVRESIKGSKAVILESNHDVGMLQKGIYPFETKQRILSDEGHLSNTLAASELPFLIKNGTSRFLLAHLSRDNNTPNLARVASEAVLNELSLKNGEDYLLSVAPPDSAKMMWL